MLPPQPSARAIKAAKGAGGKVSITLSDPFCIDRHRDAFAKMLREDVDLLFANRSEILSMYGGGFPTVPAYLADVFGTQFVGAIHGRLLTAWSAAGVFGPVLVNYIREYQIDHGVAKADAYSITMYIMAGLLFIGFICNLLMHPVHERHHIKSEEAKA